MESERGFSLLEVLVALGIGTLVLLGAANATVGLLHARATVAARFDDRAATAALIAAIRSDNETATGFSIPPTDSAGAPNLDAHAFDLDTRAAGRAERIVEYRWVAADSTQPARVLRSEIDASGIVAPRLTQSYAGITALSARSIALSALAGGGSDGDPLFAGAALHDVAIDLGDGASAGNALLAVTIATAHALRTVRLANLAAPTHFTYVLQYTPAP